MKNLLTCLSLLISANQLASQTWELTLPKFDNVYPIAETENSDLIFLSDSNRLIKIDSTGKVLVEVPHLPEEAGGWSSGRNFFFQKLPNENAKIIYLNQTAEAKEYLLDKDLKHTPTYYFELTKNNNQHRQPLRDGKLIHAGAIGPNFVVELLDEKRNLIWKKNHASNAISAANFTIQEICTDAAGNFIAICESHSYGFLSQIFPISERLLVVYSPTGEKLFSKTLNYQTGSTTSFSFWLFEHGGIIAVAGNYFSSNNEFAGARIDFYNTADGELLQTFKLAEPQKTIRLADIKQKLDGSLVLLTNESINNTSSRTNLTKLDFSGNFLSKSTIFNHSIQANGLLLLADGGYVLTGQLSKYPARDAYIVRLDSLEKFEKTTTQIFAFLDENENCQFDAGEKPFPNLVLETNFYPNYFVSTDSNGQVEVATPLGQLQFKPAAGAYFKPCQTSINVLSEFGKKQVVEVPIKKLAACPLLHVDLSASHFRPCADGFFTVQYQNLGSAAADAPQVVVELDPKLEFKNASLPPKSVVGQVLTFDLPKIEALQKASFQIFFKTDCGVFFGETLCSTARISPDSLCLPDLSATFGNEQPSVGKFCQTTSNNFPSQDKTLYPLPQQPGSKFHPDSTFHYLIRFQNTSGATVSKVLVRDYLPPSLDPTTLVLGAASHPYIFSMRDNSTMDFLFENIQLVDSASDQTASQGYLQFAVRARKNPFPSTQVYNKADIFFGNNPPVSTYRIVYFDYKKEDVELEIDTSICRGQALFGLKIFSDTMVTFTGFSGAFKTYWFCTVKILPTFKIEKDTTLAVGTLFNGFPVPSGLKKWTFNYKTEHGCDSIRVWNILGTTVASKDLAPQADIEISPNPFSAEIWLKTKLENFKNHCQIELADATGRLVFSKKCEPQSLVAGVRVPTENLPPGIYFLKFLEIETGQFFSRHLVK